MARRACRAQQIGHGTDRHEFSAARLGQVLQLVSLDVSQLGATLGVTEKPSLAVGLRCAGLGSHADDVDGRAQLS
jgi:hypothetical protein